MELFGEGLVFDVTNPVTILNKNKKFRTLNEADAKMVLESIEPLAAKSIERGFVSELDMDLHLPEGALDPIYSQSVKGQDMTARALNTWRFTIISSQVVQDHLGMASADKESRTLQKFWKPQDLVKDAARKVMKKAIEKAISKNFKINVIKLVALLSAPSLSSNCRKIKLEKSNKSGVHLMR